MNPVKLEISKIKTLHTWDPNSDKIENLSLTSDKRKALKPGSSIEFRNFRAQTHYIPHN